MLLATEAIQIASTEMLTNYLKGPQSSDQLSSNEQHQDQ